jgi:serine/threonine-protein kinase RsbW
MIFDKTQISIHSTKEKIYKVERFIEEVCDRYNITNNYFGNISIAVMEAVENAMVHGNRNEKEKIISLDFESRPGELVFCIEDEGDGFDPQVVNDPTDVSEEIDEQVGRGLFMIRKLADEVHFNEDGNQIEMIFKIKGISEELDKERKERFRGYKDGPEREVSKTRKNSNTVDE